jgi:SAM-dependent methyltransferase
VSTIPYDATFYDGQSNGSYRSACRIVPILMELFGPASVLDVGCGVGPFLRAFVDSGVADVRGVDGDYVPRDRLLIDASRFHAQDLGQPLDLGRRFDLVMSLEVAEHLPGEKAGLFVDNLCRHGSTIIFSAAIPAQGGTGHVNERWPSYWISLFAARGYRAFDIVRPKIWADESVEYWYRQNILVFAEEEAPHTALRREADVDAPIDIVHPTMYSAKVWEARKVEAARNLQSVFEKLCSDGGAYTFSRGGDGSVIIRRVQ